MNDPMRALEVDARLLESALREDWPRQDPRLRELLQRRPQWSEMLDGPPPDLPTSRADDGPDRRLTDELLALARQRAQRRAPAWRERWSAPWRLVAAAAALLLVGALLSRPWSGSAGEERVEVLGTDSEAPRIHSLTPQGSVDGHPVFAWRCERELRPGESFLVVLRETANDGRPRDVLLQRKTTDPQWTPDAFDLADLPSRFHWSVQWVSASGVAGPAVWASVEFSSR